MKRSKFFVGLVLVIVAMLATVGCYNNRFAPHGLTAVVVENEDGTYKVVLEWIDNSPGENGFLLERTVIEGDWSEAVQFDLVSNTVYFEDATVENGTTYWYRVAATWYDHDIRRRPEEVVVAEIPGEEPPPPVEPPASPGPLSALYDVNTDTVFLEWLNVANEDGYRLYKQIGSGEVTLFAELGADVASVSDTVFSEGNTVKYYVVAWNSGGNSPQSNTAEVYIEPAENPEATVFLDTVALDGRTVRQILSDEGFDVHFGTKPPPVEGMYDYERDNGGVISNFEAELSSQVNPDIEYTWTDGPFVFVFDDEIITGTGNLFTLWYTWTTGSTEYLYAQSGEQNESTGVITSETVRMKIAGSTFSLSQYSDTLTPQ